MHSGTMAQALAQARSPRGKPWPAGPLEEEFPLGWSSGASLLTKQHWPERPGRSYFILSLRGEENTLQTPAGARPHHSNQFGTHGLVSASNL